MNDTGGGVTAIHDVPGDITRIGFHWMLLFFLSVTRRVALLFCLHTENRGDHGFSLSRIFEFSNFFFTRNVSEVTVFFFVPNFRFFEFFLHAENRGDYGFSLSRFFSLSRICELFPSHGMSRNNLFYHELSNYRISFTRRIAEITDFLCHETCPWTH